MSSNSKLDSTHYVIGSGPAGVACAKALLARGARVAMLDAGVKLEPETSELVRRLAGKPPAEWSEAERATLKSRMEAGVRGVGQKLQFNSDFAYRGTQTAIPWQGEETGLLPSLALGGLSNVWGAAMLPHRDEDLADWPVKSADLAPHYRAVAEFADVAAQNDGLSEWFPLYQDRPKNLHPGQQAARLLRNLDRRADALRSAGWRYGQSRVAIRTGDSRRGRGCVYCRECMGGCVYGSIYNSAQTVAEMLGDPNFTYQGDVIVRRVNERAGGIQIEAIDRNTREPKAYEAERVFLGAGVIPTAQIVLRSQAAFGHPLVLRDSQYFMLPLLTGYRAPGVRSEALFTLSQIFLEISHPRVSRHTVHLQLYTHNDIIGNAVRQTMKAWKGLAGLIDGRLIIIQGFLHSNDSQTISMVLKRDGAGDVLELKPKPNPETRPTVKRVVRELLRQSRALGGVVVAPMLQILEPGRGFHCGGSLPMRGAPADFECDVLGRPRGWSRLHIVDASVLPSAPATTITFPLMANAHRIGTAAAAL